MDFYTPTMAPLPPLGRAHVIERIARGGLPFRFGSPHPSVMVLEEDGRFRLRELVISREEARAAAEAAHARQDSFMPEDLYELGRPTGRIYADAASRLELIELLRTIDWPESW